MFGPMADSDFYSSKLKHVLFYTEVSPDTAHDLREALFQAAASDARPLAVHMHSPGGASSLGITFINFMRELPVPACVVVDGMALSAATPVLVSAPYRVMHEHALVMFHEGSMVMRGMLRESEFDFQNRRMRAESRRYLATYRRHTEVPPEVLNDMLARDLFMTAKDCKRYKVVDRVLAFSPRAVQGVYGRHLAPGRESTKCDLSKDIRMWGACSHVYAYNNTDHKRPDHLLSLVLPLQQYMEGPRAVVMHYGDDMLPSRRVYLNVLPLLPRICLSRVPVVAVIDNDIDLIKALPCIVSHRRYMYDGVVVVVSLITEHHDLVMTYYDDIRINIEAIRNETVRLLRRWTRMPESMLKALFRTRVELSAADCLRLGIVDEVLPAVTLGAGRQSRGRTARARDG